MRKKLGRIANHCFNVASSPVMWFLVALFAVVLFSFIMDAVKNLRLWKDMVTLPEPEQCALCADKGIVRTYPCLVKLETGQIGQMKVDDIGAEYLEEIVQFQETGIYTYGFFCAGQFASTTTSAEYSTTSVTLPKKPLYINPGLFCRDCRAKIGEIIGEERIYLDGYILADLYDLENIRTYAVTDGAVYDILGYTVEVTGQTVTVTRCLE